MSPGDMERRQILRESREAILLSIRLSVARGALLDSPAETGLRVALAEHALRSEESPMGEDVGAWRRMAAFLSAASRQGMEVPHLLAGRLMDAAERADKPRRQPKK